jgi:ectoine hydroxylase-related dioxygenase (phytanoyl-CoA dioxygenase family)
MSLDSELAAFFLREGYARLPGTLPVHLIENVRSVVDELFADPGPPNRVNEAGEVSRIDGLLDRDPIFLEILRTSFVVDPLRALLGPNVEVVRHRHNHATLNRRGDIPFRLHRDIQNWSRALVSVFIYLEAATVENGCTHVVPGSHQLPYAGPQSGDGGGNWADEHAEYASLLGQELPIPMPLGGVLFLNSLAFHSVGENRTATSRKSMVFACHSSDELSDDFGDDSRILLVGQRQFKGNSALRVSGSLTLGSPQARATVQRK